MTTILSELFNRSVSNQWTGGSFAWTLTLAAGGNNPNDWDINGTKGTVTHTATNELHYASANVGVPNHKVNTVVNLSAADVTGAAATAFLVARMTDISNFYSATLQWSTAEAVTLTLQKRVAGTLSTIGSTTIAVGTFTAAATTQIAVSLYVVGSRLYAKAWAASGTEPDGWQIAETDTSLTTGNLAGVGNRRETGNTNTNLAFEYDRFTASVVALTAVTQDVYPPRVLLSLTDLTLGDSVQLYRVVGGERTAVRAGADPDVSDPSFLRVDAELPFGVPVTYLAVVNDTDEYTAGPTTYVLPGGKVVLSDAISGAAAETVILSWPEKQYDRRSSTFQVGGRNVVVVGPPGQFTSDIEVYTEQTSSRDTLAALLRTATGGVVQVRQPGGYDGVDCYIAVTGYVERRFSQDGSDQRRVHAMRSTEVEGWAPALEAGGFTLQDIADAYDGLTLADLAADYATLLALAQGDFS